MPAEYRTRFLLLTLTDTLFSSAKARIRAQCRPVLEYNKVETLYSGTKVSTGSLYTHRFY